MKVLVVNAGSTTLKYQLIETENYSMLAKGNCERIGFGGKVEHKLPNGVSFEEERPIETHAEAAEIVVSLLTDKTYGCINSLSEIKAVGHRIVHGGKDLFETTYVNEDTLAQLEKCREIDPLHIPGAIMGIKACLEALPNVPQTLVFDTAFHHTMPKEAYTYPIPKELATKYGIRKYGFHGTSHKYVSLELIKLLGKPAEETRLITCHLGGGSSIAAIKGGKVIDTTMGFTSLDGLAMATRSGSIDPAAVTFLMEKEHLSPSEMDNLLNKQSGMLGICGMTDCRDICREVEEGNEDAITALHTMCYQIKKYIGSYTFAMGGLDAIAFTAGIGENQYPVRELSLAGLEELGIELDLDVNRNVKRPAPITLLSKPESKVKVYLIPTNEELMIAQETEALLSK